MLAIFQRSRRNGQLLTHIRALSFDVDFLGFERNVEREHPNAPSRPYSTFMRKGPPSDGKSGRGFSSEAQFDSGLLRNPATQGDVAAILQTTAVLQFREELKGLATERPCIELAEFETMAKASGVASSEEELLRVIDAMSTAGVVLRFRNLIYLRPKEVAGIVMQILPESHLTAAQIETALQQTRAELQPLQDTFMTIEAKAGRRARWMMYGGLTSLVGQLALFLRLTYYDLSWDVMEPVAYFTSVVFMIMAYGYFMSAGKEYSYEDLNRRLVNRYKKMYLTRHAFDEKRYNDLKETVLRYERRVNLMKFLRAAK